MDYVTRTASLADLPEKIRTGDAVISVLGLGRVGLPLAVVLARSGFRVIGVDVDDRTVSMIRKGEMPFFYPAIHEWLKEVLVKGMLSVSSDTRTSIGKSDVIVVTVGTPTGVQYQLDYYQLHSAFREMATADLRNKAIIMRSTSVPGTLSNIILPLLAKESGLKPGVDFALAACHERILEGQAHRELYELPEIVGGIDSLSIAIASELFHRINPKKKILATTPTAAELAKLFTNIYRYVQFALANEFAIWAERYGEDASQIIKIANEGYPRSNIPRPGFAGGPCLSKDGFLLDNNTTFSSIVSVAWKLNEAIPQHVVSCLVSEFGSLYGRKIAVLGLAFKADSDDVRLSPSAKLVEILKAYGAEVLAHDPHVMNTQSLEYVLRSPEAVILATNHSVFKDLATTIDHCGCKVIYDVWSLFNPDDFSKARYRRFGRAG
ncbi:MAG TPA: nucleotide sugar dehydrogenase [Candidatus Bathyarchaeia archaeon]|nr:nucleotide sugar dehydrogenase [Candidatus Bathyarchaeia archaeon]